MSEKVDCGFQKSRNMDPAVFTWPAISTCNQLKGKVLELAWGASNFLWESLESIESLESLQNYFRISSGFLQNYFRISSGFLQNYFRIILRFLQEFFRSSLRSLQNFLICFICFICSIGSFLAVFIPLFAATLVSSYTMPLLHH